MNLVTRGYGHRLQGKGSIVATFGLGRALFESLRKIRVQSLDSSMAFATSGPTRQVMSAEKPAVAVSLQQTNAAMSTVRRLTPSTQNPDLTHITQGPDLDAESTLPETDRESQALELAPDSASYDETTETTIPATLAEEE